MSSCVGRCLGFAFSHEPCRAHRASEQPSAHQSRAAPQSAGTRRGVGTHPRHEPAALRCGRTRCFPLVLQVGSPPWHNSKLAKTRDRAVEAEGEDPEYLVSSVWVKVRTVKPLQTATSSTAAVTSSPPQSLSTQRYWLRAACARERPRVHRARPQARSLLDSTACVSALCVSRAPVGAARSSKFPRAPRCGRTLHAAHG